MAIACLVDRAPILPSRISSIVSLTNSPACVEGALPSRSSCLAFSMVSGLGMVALPFVRLKAVCDLLRLLKNMMQTECHDEGSAMTNFNKQPGKFAAGQRVRQ